MSSRDRGKYRIHRRVLKDTDYSDLLYESEHWSVCSVRAVLHTLNRLYYEVNERDEEVSASEVRYPDGK